MMMKKQLSQLLATAISLGLLLVMTTDGSRLGSQRFLQESPPDNANTNNDTEDLNGTDANVVGGTNAASGEFPFFVRFGDGSCGGTLISANRVLTAAHCIRNGAPSTVRINSVFAGLGTTHRVCCSKTHPNWNPNDPFKNDVAVLKLCCNVCNPNLVPLNTNTGVPVGGSNVRVIGFGQTTAGGGTGVGSNRLQKMTYSSVSDADCKTAWGDAVTEGLHVCAQNTNSQGACFGDSGGPLLAEGSSTQYGIVSGGSSQCAAGGVPDVYTDVAAFNSWIVQQISSTECDEPCGCARLTLAGLIPNAVSNFFADDNTFW